jgi:hypothetical protein
VTPLLLPKRVNSEESLGSLSDNEDGGNTSWRNVGEHLPTIRCHVPEDDFNGHRCKNFRPERSVSCAVMLKSIESNMTAERSSWKGVRHYVEMWDDRIRGF